MLNRMPNKKSVVVVYFLLLTGCSIYQPGFDSPNADADDYEIASIINDIVYTRDDWPTPLSGNLYLPLRSDATPVVITIHGGGWSSRSRVDMHAIALKLAKRGYAVFNISYRFAPEYTYPAQLQDVQQALYWVNQSADEYRFDREKISTWGYSSGAHLAALAAGIDTTDERLPNIRSVVVGGIPADLTQYSGSPIIIPFIGGDRHEKPDTYREASPITHVSSDDPPVFLYHGNWDMLVESEQSINYHKALEAKSIKSELYLHRIWGHFAMFLWGGDAEDRAIEFLDFHNL